MTKKFFSEISLKSSIPTIVPERVGPNEFGTPETTEIRLGTIEVVPSNVTVNVSDATIVYPSPNSKLEKRMLDDVLE